MTEPIIMVGDSKGLGINSENTIVEGEADRVFLDGKIMLLSDEQSATGTDYEKQFDDWLNGCRNKQVPAVSHSDYVEAANRLGCDVKWLIAVFKVESQATGFNRDGTSKTLFERHLLRRAVLKELKQYSSKIRKNLGRNLYAIRFGGYKGGIAEWQRIKQAVVGIAGVTGDFEQALNIGLGSASHGKPQILGKWAKPYLGYGTPKQMVEAFHANEDEHLKSFCGFVEKNGLDTHLVNASKSSNPYPHIVKFAKGYNGPRCCDRGAKRKNYAAEMMAEYRRIKDEPVEFKGLSKSRAQQGNTIGGGAAAAGGGLGVVALSDLSTLTEKAKEYSAQFSELKHEVAQISPQLTERFTGFESQLSDMRGLVIALIAISSLSLIGVLWSAYARYDDRRKGYK